MMIAKFECVISSVARNLERFLVAYAPRNDKFSYYLLPTGYSLACVCSYTTCDLTD